MMTKSTQQRRAHERFATAQKLEMEYMRSLRQLARQVDNIVKGMAREGKLRDAMAVQQALRKYAEAIEPWAQSVAEKMLVKIAKKDEAAWVQMGRDIGRELRKELNDAPTGDFLRQMLSEQVHLITSLPLEAAKRVHELTIEAQMDSSRADEIAKKILETGDVTKSRAQLIARTEVARTASGLTMARAKHVGSTHYIWRTSRDGTVRESHRHMEGKVIPWDTPPKLEDGTQTHAGMIYNCRCWAEPLLTLD